MLELPTNNGNVISDTEVHHFGKLSISLLHSSAPLPNSTSALKRFFFLISNENPNDYHAIIILSLAVL